MLLLSGLNIDESSTNDIYLSLLCLTFLDHQNRAKEFNLFFFFGGIIGTVRNLNPGMYGSYLGEERFLQLKPTSLQAVKSLTFFYQSSWVLKSLNKWDLRLYALPSLTLTHPWCPKNLFLSTLCLRHFLNQDWPFSKAQPAFWSSSTSVLILDDFWT